MQTARQYPAEIRLTPLILTSLIAGFLLVPLHELGHVVCHGLTGNPEGMSYARDYLLGGSKHTFFGVLGGPLFPLLLAGTALALIRWSSISLSTLYPLAVLGATERLVLYLAMGLPSDERELADFVGWTPWAFEYIILAIEIALLAVIVFTMARAGVKPVKMVLCVVLPVVAFVGMALLGVMVVERYFFPEQFHLQFG